MILILKVFIDSAVTTTVGEIYFSLISKHLLVWKDSSKNK